MTPTPRCPSQRPCQRSVPLWPNCHRHRKLRHNLPPLDKESRRFGPLPVVLRAFRPAPLCQERSLRLSSCRLSSTRLQARRPRPVVRGKVRYCHGCYPGSICRPGCLQIRDEPKSYMRDCCRKVFQRRSSSAVTSRFAGSAASYCRPARSASNRAFSKARARAFRFWSRSPW